MQRENKEIKEERNTYRRQLNDAFTRGFIHKDSIKVKLAEAEKKIKHYKAARGSGKPIQTHIKLVRLITEVEIYKELLNIK